MSPLRPDLEADESLQRDTPSPKSTSKFAFGISGRVGLAAACALGLAACGGATSAAGTGKDRDELSAFEKKLAPTWKATDGGAHIAELPDGRIAACTIIPPFMQKHLDIATGKLEMALYGYVPEKKCDVKVNQNTTVGETHHSRTDLATNEQSGYEGQDIDHTTTIKTAGSIRGMKTEYIMDAVNKDPRMCVIKTMPQNLSCTKEVQK